MRPQSATGPTGPQGPQGVQGIAGPTGPVGPTGPSGPLIFKISGANVSVLAVGRYNALGLSIATSPVTLTKYYIYQSNLNSVTAEYNYM
jgi:hypothetical protein